MQALMSSLELTPPIAGIHIRHGDLKLRFEFGDKAGQRAYQNRPYHDAEDYFSALRDAVDSDELERPGSVYVASDGDQSAAIEEESEDMWDGNPPKFVTLKRYRNKHGAHTSSTLMALPYSAKVELSKVPERERAINFRKMLREAIEDIYILSKSDYFIGTASSHFTSLATYLRVGKDETLATRSIFLDTPGLVSGAYCPGLFHGTINGTSRLLKPHERHQIMHRRFLDRLHLQSDLVPPNVFHFDTKRAFYGVPAHTFDQEGARWKNPKSSRMWEWTRTDPSILRNSKALLDRIVQLVNDGATMDNFWSYGIALGGWKHAKKLIDQVNRGKLKLDVSKNVMEQLVDVVTGNIEVHKRRHAGPYVKLYLDPNHRTYLEGNK
uniref:Uncharacterized protein n=1 Tax=Lotharella oceanica TaxID=641309 RepID=A0A7S2XHG3_9EUKA